MKIKKSLLKYVFPKASIEARLAAIRGEKTLSPGDFVTVLFILTHDTEQQVVSEAASALKLCPEPTVMAALGEGLASEVIAYIAESFPENEKVLDLLVLDENIDDETLTEIASGGPTSVIDVIAECERLLKKPFVLPALKQNPNVTPDIIERVSETGSMAEDAASDALMDDYDDEDSLGIYQMIQSMSVGDKIKLALTGNKEARSTLLKQSNKVVSRSVIRNPRITEDEVVQVTQTRSVSDEILREIARNEEWLKSYPIKRGLAFNPKTPVQVTLRLMSKLNVKDLAVLSKSKGVPNIVAAAARKIADRKKI
jgi:hypothetical protein